MNEQENNATLEPSDDMLQEENARLKEDLAVKIAAIESLLLNEMLSRTVRDELRARAFPPTEPEWEEMPVQKLFCPKCENFYSKDVSLHWECCKGTPLIELNGTRRIPKRKKVLRREEMQPIGKPAGFQFFAQEGSRYFREWDE